MTAGEAQPPLGFFRWRRSFCKTLLDCAQGMREHRHVLILFLDGVGIGPCDEATNPFCHASLPNLQGLLEGQLPFSGNSTIRASGATLVPVDATLGMEGLPQSGTGQTTLLTGINAAQLIGRHLGPYPDASLRQLIAEGNLFKAVVRIGGRVTFANAFPDIYLDRLARGKGRRSAIIHAVQAAGLSLRGPLDLQEGQAVSAFLTNRRWQQRGFGHPPLISPHQAGKNLYRLSCQFHLTAFEYFLTDIGGHRPQRDFVLGVLHQLDGLIGGILAHFDEAECLLAVVSDHGNLEDWTTRKHTRNPVPALFVGKGHGEVSSGLNSLADVAPAILSWLSDQL